MDTIDRAVPIWMKKNKISGGIGSWNIQSTPTMQVYMENIKNPRAP